MNIFSDWLSLLFWYVLFVMWMRAELSDDFLDLNPLLEAENTLLDTFNNYIEHQEAQLMAVKQQLTLFIKVHEQVQNNSPEYLSNPINRFLFVRRLIHEKRQMEILLKQDNHQDLMNNLISLQGKIKFPSDYERSLAADILIHLQTTYKLDTQSISRGEIYGIKCSPELSEDDCFELGEHCYIEDNLELATLWFREALRKYDINPSPKNTFKWQILEYLAYCLYKLGEVSEAFELTKELVSIFPQHQRAINNLLRYKKLMENESTEVQTEELQNYEITTKERVKDQSVEDQIRANNERSKLICRKEIELPIQIRTALKCQYVNKGNPYLFIAPLKEEEAYLNPRIVLYHEVLHNTEIETIKTLAAPELTRASVRGTKTVEGEISSLRVSKSAVIKDAQHAIYQTVMHRVEDMTSLNTDTVDGIQVVNYGVGGHCKPHYDFFQISNVRNYSDDLPGTDRTATVLFYLNDVEQGGATVFPHLNFGVWPQKGTAIFWYNLHTSGAADFRTLHAACPILLNFKWVATVWIRESGQMFFRPCHLADLERQSIS